MKFESTNKRIFSLLLIVFLIILDQLSKNTIRSSGGFYICNKGIAFGIVLPPIIFWLFCTIILALIVIQIFNFKFLILNEFPNFEFKISNYSLVLILSGAISNIIDRLYFGCVIDFIKLPYWPVFNLADTMIVLGVMISLIKITSSKSQIPNKSPAYRQAGNHQNKKFQKQFRDLRF